MDQCTARLSENAPDVATPTAFSLHTKARVTRDNLENAWPSALTVDTMRNSSSSACMSVLPASNTARVHNRLIGNMKDWKEYYKKKYGIRVKVKRSLSLTWGPEEISFFILRAAKESERLCRSCPTGLAAAACYVAVVLTGKNIPLKKISRAAHVNEETIRNRSNDLLSNLLITIAL